MKPSRPVALPLVGALALSPVPGAFASPQAPPAQTLEVPTFGISAAAVTLDVVVRDKKGNAVRDLKAEDFAIYEDGVLQSVDTFGVFGSRTPPPPATTAGRATAAATPAAPAAVPPAPAADETPAETRPQVVALLFDRLSPNARRVAKTAALTYVDKGRRDTDMVGVFGIDLALRSLQPFTNDPALIRAGLEKAAMQANTGFADNREQTRSVVATAMAGAAQADALSGANPGRGADSSAIANQAAAASLNSTMFGLQTNMLRNFEALERDQQGYASVNGLLAVVTGLRSLPGRKTVVFFSEGLSITSNVQDQFRDVIHAANRGNVAVYTMDAAGLRALSLNDEARKEMMQAMDRRIQQLESGRDDGSAGPMMQGLERNEDLMRLSAESGLGQLANETGAFMIRDTNDAEGAFRRIEEDMRFHYLLGYTPSNENYNGKFRAIQVKVARSGLAVQTRQGYFAIRAIESSPLRSYEAPALAKVEQRSTIHDFPLEVAALNFPAADRPGLSPVLVRAPGSAVSYEPDKQDKSGQRIQRADFSIIVRVLDPNGREVDRLSQNYPLSAPQASLAAAKSGNILFYREASLPPGRYTLQAIGYDAVSQKTSVHTAPLEVRSGEPGRPHLSSVMVVGRAEKLPANEQPTENPLYFGGTILYPNMGEPVRRSAAPALGFYFTLYGVPSGPGPRKAVLEVFKDGTSAGQIATDLPAPDATGRVQYAGSLPMTAFPPGSYRLKVTATTANGSDSRDTSFTVAE